MGTPAFVVIPVGIYETPLCNTNCHTTLGGSDIFMKKWYLFSFLSVFFSIQGCSALLDSLTEELRLA